jgi:hypothetical protein
MTTRAQELLALAAYLTGIVDRCRVRRVLGACSICEHDGAYATQFARRALLSTLRKRALCLTYEPRPMTRYKLRVALFGGDADRS